MQTTDEKPPPYVPPPSTAPKKNINTLQYRQIGQWLWAGMRDCWFAPGISFFYGMAFWFMALLIRLVFSASPEYTLSITSGCLLVGPFLAMGLYEVSRRRSQGMPADFSASLTCWDQHIRSMGMLILVLMVLELLWGRASLVVFAVFFNSGIDPAVGVMKTVFRPENWEFLAVYSGVGAVFALIVYAISVISIPAILDRDLDAISAGVTSLEVVGNNTGVMLVWGGVITTVVAAALLSPWSLALLVLGPLLGHASWHAYKASVVWLETPAASE